MIDKTKWKTIVKGLALLVGLIVALKILLPAINTTEFQTFITEIGIWGYVIVIVYIVLSHVFAPIAGSPAVAMGITLYGIHTGSWLLYVASLISATINFVIAKKYGRGWVVKLVGEDSMGKVDEFAAVKGKGVLILSRLFGFSLFDFISYAAGLTPINYREYILITAICGVIPNIIMQYVFRSIDFGTEQGVLIWGASIMSVAIVFGLILKIYLRKPKN